MPEKASGEVRRVSKLREFVSKGVRLIVTDDASAPPRDESEREIPAEDLLEEEETRPVARGSGGRSPAPPPPPPRSTVAADVSDFAAVYDEAGIAVPDHGYGIEKVAGMLESKRLASLGREVKATAVLAAIEAAGVNVRDVIQDAVRRDKALDDFEAAKEAEVRELKSRSETRVQAIKEEIDAFLRAKNQEIEELKQAADGATTAFTQLQTRKRREEDRLQEIVSHFVEPSDNPISTQSSRPAPPPPPRSSGS
jgi:hypothetical protein